jgi:hypothetical protein
MVGTFTRRGFVGSAAMTSLLRGTATAAEAQTSTLGSNMAA